MKKIVYIFGSIEILAGVLLLSLTSIIKEVLPILGRIAFQVAAAGSYDPSDYSVSLGFVNIIAVVLIVIGIVQVCIFAVKKTDE